MDNDKHKSADVLRSEIKELEQRLNILESIKERDNRLGLAQINDSSYKVAIPKEYKKIFIIMLKTILEDELESKKKNYQNL